MSQETKAGEPVAYVRFCSDGGYEGPIMATDKRMVGARAMAWTPLYLAPPDTEALRQRVAHLEAELKLARQGAEYCFNQAKDADANAAVQNAAVHELAKQLATQAEQIEKLKIEADPEALHISYLQGQSSANATIRKQAEQINRLQMALADTEALELGTAERCEKQAEQIKVAVEALNKLRGMVTADEALAKLGEQ